MSSLIGRFVPGYDTYWMAVGMIIPTTILLVLLVVSAMRTLRTYPSMHWVTAGTLAISIALIISAQTNVEGTKHIKRTTHPSWAADFARQADQMQWWTTGLVFTSLVLTFMTVWYAFESLPERPPVRPNPNDKFNLAWALAIGSCTASMFGVFLDYKEWLKITVNKSQGSAEVFRFPGWLHYGLSSVSFALAAAAIVVFVIKWRAARSR